MKRVVLLAYDQSGKGCKFRRDRWAVLRGTASFAPTGGVGGEATPRCMRLRSTVCTLTAQPCRILFWIACVLLCHSIALRNNAHPAPLSLHCLFASVSVSVSVSRGRMRQCT